MIGLLATFKKRINIFKKIIETDTNGREQISFEILYSNVPCRILSTGQSKRYVDIKIADKYDYIVYIQDIYNVNIDDIIEYNGEKYSIKKIVKPSENNTYIKIYINT